MTNFPPTGKAHRKAEPPPSGLTALGLWATSSNKTQLGVSFLMAAGVTFVIMTLFPSAPRAFPDPGLGLMAVFVAPFVATAIALIWVGRRLRAR